MSSRYLIFGSLAAMLALVGVLLFATMEKASFQAGATGDEGSPGMVVPGSAGAGSLEGSFDDPADDPVVEPDPPVGPAADSLPPGAAPDAVDAPVDGDAEPATEPYPAPVEPVERGERGERGAAAQDPDVEAILRATSRRYEDIRSFQAGFRQEITNPLLGTRYNSAGILYQRQPDRFLMRFSDPDGDVIVSDGEFFWMYFPSTDARQVIRSRRGAEGLDLRSQFVGDPLRRFEATYHGREELGERTAHVLTLVPREALGYRRLKVWIDTADHLVRRFELTEDSGLVRHFVLGDIRINPALGDDLFRFTPPAGARVIDQG